MIKKNIIFLISFLVILLLLRSKLSFYNLNRHQVPFSSIESLNLVDNVPNDPSNGTPQSIFDGNLQSGFNCVVKQKECDNILYFKSSQKIDQIEIYFSYNLARQIFVEYQTLPNTPWKSLETIKDNNFSLVTVSNALMKKEKISTLRLSFSTPGSENGKIGIGEIRAFYLPQDNLLTRLTQKLFYVKREPLCYVYYSLIFLALTIFVGFGITFRKVSSISPIDLSMVWLKSVLILSLLGITSLITKTNIVMIITLSILITISLFKLINNKISISNDSKTVIVLMIVYLVNLLFFFNFNGYNDIKLIEEYDSKYDNSIYFPTQYGAYQTDFQLPYAVTKVWNYDLSLTNPAAEKIMTGYKPSDRTPLLSLYSLPFLAIFGDRHFIFEIISIVISPVFILGCWVLINSIFNKKIATITSIFLTFNHWIFFASHFGQVRLLVLFFLLLFFYYSYRLLTDHSNKLIVMASLSSTLAFLSHPFALIYIAPIALFQLICFRKSHIFRSLFLLTKIYFFPVIAFIIWQIWSRLEPGNSLLIASMISSSWENTNKTMQMVRPIQIDNFQKILSAKLDNLLGVFIANPRQGVIRSYGPFRTTLLPAISIILTPFVFISLFVFPSKINKIITYFSFFVIFITTAFYLSFYAILGLNWYNIGLIPLLVGTATLFIAKLPRWCQWVVLCLSMIEYYYITYIHFSFEAGNSVYYKLLNQKWGIAFIIFFLFIQSVSIFRIWPKASKH